MTKITVEIINYIKRKKEGELKNWYAGITNDLTERKQEHEREKNVICKHLSGWLCETENEAREIEKELEELGIPTHKKDLKIISKKKEPSNIVYVFLAVSKDY